MKRSIVALCLILSACAGTPFKWDQARQIKEGMTTNEVTAIMGSPTSVTSRSDSLIYVWVHVNGLTAATRSMSVVFKDGKVREAPQIPDTY